MARTCAMNGSGFVCISTRASTLIQTPKRRCKPRADEPAHAVFLRHRAHATLADDLGPLLEQLTAPVVVVTRGARERQRRDALAVQHADDLGDDATHRRADDVRTFDAFGVEHLDRVFGHAQQVVRARRRVARTGAAVVGGDAAVPATERSALERPPPAVHAETLDHETGRAVPLDPTRRYAILTPSVVRMSGTSES